MSRALVLVAAFTLVASGCLAAFPTDPGGSASPASGSGGSGGGTSSSGDGSGGSAGSGGGGGAVAADMAVAGGDLAGGPAADMANAASADMANNCIKLATPVQDGHHNAGQACLSCHNGGGPTKFTWAGTLYNAASGGAVLSGATIEVIDANGKVNRIITSSDGNFYSTTTLTPPFTVRASGCPNNTAMVSKATGDCNSSGCHTSAMRVHLP